MISNTTCSLKLASKKKGTCNIMKSYDQSCNGSNLIGTISYYNLSQGWPLINHSLPNLIYILGQSSESTYTINFLNQCTQSTFSSNLRNQPFQSIYIELAAPLACDTSLPQTYIRRRVYSYLLRYIWFRWLTFLQITYFSSYGEYHSRAPLGGGVDESPAKCS